MMKLRQLTIALSAVGFSSLGLVGCGGDSKPYPLASTVEGIAVLNGVVASANVCIDSNRSKTCDDGEVTVTTGADGRYSLPAKADGPIVLESTADTKVQNVATGDPAAALVDPNATDPVDIGPGLFMTAPGNASVISPYTTLAQIKSELNNVSFAQAQNEVLAAIGGTVPAGTDFLTYNYSATPRGGDADKIRALADALGEVISTNITTINNAVAGSDNSTNTNAIRSLAVFDLFDSEAGADSTLKQIEESPATATTLAITSSEAQADIEDVVNAINTDAALPDSTGSTGGTGSGAL